MYVSVDAKLLSVKERRARNENSEPICRADEESQKSTLLGFEWDIEFFSIPIFNVIKYNDKYLTNLNTLENLVIKKCALAKTTKIKFKKKTEKTSNLIRIKYYTHHNTNTI